jgi:Flp pilus assembly CpaF family ATPase
LVSARTFSSAGEYQVERRLLLNVLTEFIPTIERIVLIEDTAEIQISEARILSLAREDPVKNRIPVWMAQ